MCSVELLRPGADMGGRVGALPPRVGVRRRLFGAPKDCGAALEAALLRRAAERWNFNFADGVPMPGRYQWVTAETVLSARNEEKVGAKQLKITEFLRKRKRHSEESEFSKPTKKLSPSDDCGMFDPQKFLARSNETTTS